MYKYWSLLEGNQTCFQISIYSTLKTFFFLRKQVQSSNSFQLQTIRKNKAMKEKKSKQTSEQNKAK